jgi:D-tagatose-1,6-bisphosphate aldolase subunit GatZ/KbaZ-like
LDAAQRFSQCRDIPCKGADGQNGISAHNAGVGKATVPRDTVSAKSGTEIDAALTAGPTIPAAKVRIDGNPVAEVGRGDIGTKGDDLAHKFVDGNKGKGRTPAVYAHEDVIQFDPEKACALSLALRALPGIVFEAHSTDYQTEDGLRQLANGGFSILKVGPWLTYALREALYGLDAIADVPDGHPPRNRMMRAMEGAMQAAPGNWARNDDGDARDLWLQRHVSYSDRIRYYWPDPAARAAVAGLSARLGNRAIPAPVLDQYLPQLADASQTATFDSLLLHSVTRVLGTCQSAIGV